MKRPIITTDMPDWQARLLFDQWTAYKNRRRHRQEAIRTLLRSPRLGIALLAAPILDLLRDKAATIIQQAHDAEFERAAEQVLEQRKREAEQGALRRTKHDAHVRARRVDILVKQGCWWLEQRKREC